jgi:hypothetical protein
MKSSASAFKPLKINFSFKDFCGLFCGKNKIFIVLKNLYPSKRYFKNSDLILNIQKHT